jgi:hypothetical protein
MRRAPGLLLGLTWFGTWLGISAGRDGWLHSFAQSSDMVNTAVVLLWPLAVGVGAAQSVAACKGGLLERLAAWPGNGVWRYAWSSVWRAWLGACAGGGIAWAVSAVTATAFGSPVSAESAPGLTIAMGGTLGALLWGWVCGLVARSYVTAALMPVGLYVAMWLLPAYTGFDPLSFTGATALVGTAAGLSGRGFALLLALAVCVAATALFAVRLLTANSGQGRAGRGLAIVGMVVCGVGSASLFVLGPTGLGDGPWAIRGHAAWNCQAVGDQSTACLPKDLRALGDEYSEAIERADPSIRILTGTAASILYAQSETASDESHDVFVYVDTDLADPVATWATYLASYTAGLEPGQADTDCASAIEDAQAMWQAILEGRSVSAEEVRMTSHQVAGC